MPPRQVDDDQLFGEVPAADLLGMSYRTLQAWRAEGKGPPFIRAGRAIRYRRSDLRAWMDKNTVAPCGIAAQAIPAPTPIRDSSR
jgi:excisionase family DNA binding protein